MRKMEELFDTVVAMNEKREFLERREREILRFVFAARKRLYKESKQLCPSPYKIIELQQSLLELFGAYVVVSSCDELKPCLIPLGMLKDSLSSGVWDGYRNGINSESSVIKTYEKFKTE